MSRKAAHILLLIMAMALLAAGCKKENVAPKPDLALPIAAYQYAKSEVQLSLPLPNQAVFPHYSDESVSVEEHADGIFVVKAFVSYQDPEENEIVTDDFTVTLKSLGSGLFATQSIVFEKE
jgi:hypothetical protein